MREYKKHTKRVSFRDPLDDYFYDIEIKNIAPDSLKLLSKIWLLPIKNILQMPMHLLLTKSFEKKVTPKTPVSNSYWKP